MSSKTTGKKKGASAANPRSYSEIYKSSAANAVPAAATPASVASGGAPRKAEVVAARTATSDTVDWRGEYGYVLKDLRYLGIVTGALVAGIIVVGLFL